MRNIYSPCPCESGKKFKFCCKKALSVSSQDKGSLEKVANWPVVSAYVHQDWKTEGITPVQVIRGFSNFWIFSSFLVDLWCVGVKDIILKIGISDTQLRDCTSRPGLALANYELGRSLVLGAVDFAREIEIEPCESWEACKTLVEAERPYSHLDDFSFGKDGKHFYFAGPNDDELFDVQEIARKVSQSGGNYTIPIGGSEPVLTF
jgi:hypothetical protein